MERKRDGFVPLGDVVDGLSLPGGRALTHRAAAPLARHIPRLLLAWVCTEAVRTQSRELVLGASLSAFMRDLGLDSSSGAGRRRLRTQIDRLFNATVSLIYEDAHSKQFVTSQIADRGEFWWDAKRPDQSSLWDSKIELGEKFFHEIIRRR